MRLFLLTLVTFLSFTCMSNESDEYVWKSKADPIDYKCTPYKAAGIDWDEGGEQHKLTTFAPSSYKDFFLTHISNIPTKALPSPASPLNQRRAFLESYFEYKDDYGFITETNSYFLRTQADNPNVLTTYLLSKCEYKYGHNQDKFVKCKTEQYNLELNLRSMRFVSIEIGSWHHGPIPPELAAYAFGSTWNTVINYGVCRKYFR